MRARARSAAAPAAPLPADHEQPLAPEPLGQPAGSQVRDRLGRAESDDEGKDRRGRAEAEVLLANQRQHAALETDHAADECVQTYKKRELVRVGAQTESDVAAHAAAPTQPARLAATIRSCSAGGGGSSATSASAKASASVIASSGLWERSKPIEEIGLPERPRPQTEPA